MTYSFLRNFSLGLRLLPGFTRRCELRQQWKRGLAITFGAWMSLSPCYNAELHGREMDSGRGRRGFTPHVFDQSKSGSAPQDLTKESLNKRSTTADSEYHNYWLFLLRLWQTLI